MNFFSRRARLEAEMDAELRFHIESCAEDFMKQGIPREEAMRRARAQFGGIEARKEECRESLGLRFFDELRADGRYALRMMKHNAGFTAIAALSLGLGIGANTAIFTLAKEVLMKTMAVPHPEQLRMVWWANFSNASLEHFWGSAYKNDAGEMTSMSFPYPIYAEMRRNQTAMQDLAAFKDLYKLTASVDGQAEAVDATMVSGNFYDTVGARVIAGRTILPEDDAAGAAPVAVISDAYWSRRFARSAAVLGKTIDLNRVAVTIVGVNAPDFKGPKAGGSPEIFVPIRLQQQIAPNAKGSLLANPRYWWVLVLGRLKPGVSDREAASALGLNFRNAFHATLPDKKDADMPRLFLDRGSRGLDFQTHDLSKPIYMLLGLAGLVLLIACANLANLLLARSATRQREMSLRLAMGASRGRVMRQVLTEAMMLAGMGGALGLLLGYLGRGIIPSLFNDAWHPEQIDPQPDWRVFAFAFAITLLTGLLFGAAPAWRSTRVDVNSGLKETGRQSAGRSKALFGEALVVFQVSLSLLLVVGAGLFVRTLINLHSVPVGFHPERILLFQLNPPQAQYTLTQKLAVYRQIEEKLGTLPGVQSATLSELPLLADSWMNGCFRPTGRAPRPTPQDMAFNNGVGTEFFRTVQIPIVYGRGFDARDNEHAPKVMVVNQELAKSFFPDGNPVGQTVTSCDGDKPVQYTIVGVAANALYGSLKSAIPPTIYTPYLQTEDLGGVTFAVKAAGNPASIGEEIREAVRSVDRNLPVLEMRTQTQQIDATLTSERVFATLTSGFGVLALILASIGIYGMMAYTVSRRTNEIGIRMALGARSGAVLSMVLRETLILAFVGVVVGLASAAALARLTASMLYGLKPTDPATFAAASALLALIALAAGFLPARRAARVDPMHALRHE